jgi:hypothetical protein
MQNKWGEKVREEYKYSNVGTDIPEVKNIIFGGGGRSQLHILYNIRPDLCIAECNGIKLGR